MCVTKQAKKYSLGWLCCWETGVVPLSTSSEYLTEILAKAKLEKTLAEVFAEFSRADVDAFLCKYLFQGCRESPPFGWR